FSPLFFSNDTAPTHTYTLSLHDALPISPQLLVECVRKVHAGEQWLEKQLSSRVLETLLRREAGGRAASSVLTPREIEIVRGEDRSEEHTSELQSRGHLVCRLLLEKKKKK